MALGIVAACVLLPDLIGLDTHSPFSQLVGFRPVIAACAVAITVLLGALSTRFRGLRPSAAVLAVVAVVAASLVVPRAFRDATAEPGGHQLTVLSLNAYMGEADGPALAELIRTAQPDLDALPETGRRFRARRAPLIQPMGYRVLGADGDTTELGGMTALIASRLGDVHLSTGALSAFPYIEVDGGALGALRFVAVHPLAPVPGAVSLWAADLAAVSRWCTGGSAAIIAGDLNAALDHSPLRAATQGCSDAARHQGAGLIGTWPSSLPRWFAVQIDHVLVTDGIAALAFDVHDIAGSDHRAIVTRLSVR